MNRHSQKGSALLIVLGFLSFMVVSAVAFAIWMRNERLPSSALRRTVANRFLVKAALAQAMSRVDDAIRSHVYPGAWYTNQQAEVYHDKNGRAYDWWESRVFMPPDPEGIKNPDSSGIDYPRYAPVTKTVSVLSLEALGYLPPAIANDVRLLSRSSWAAQWDYFNFDAGRYAFCAVNVSDFLDINKMAADAPRTSAAAAHARTSGQKPPPSRFSLAYLFRSSTSADSDNFSNVNGLDQFDRFVHTSREEWPTAPLVSLMDYNLSVGENKMGNLWSPFVDLASGFNNTRYFYEVGKVPTSAKIKGAERQPFVTASWFPPSDVARSDGTSSTPLDLLQNQPYRVDPNGGNANAGMESTQGQENRKFWETMKDHGHALCDLDQCSLLDYLDLDDMPLSLAMPCVERVPMITALAPFGKVQVSFTALAPKADQPPPDTKNMEQREISEASIEIEMPSDPMALQALLVHPFKEGRPDECRAQAFARLVFVAQQSAAAGGAGGGAPAPAVTLRSNGFAQKFRPYTEAEWATDVADADQFKLDPGTSDGYQLKRDLVQDCLLVTFRGQESTWGMKGDSNWWKERMPLLLQNVGKLTKPIIQKTDVYELKKSGQGEAFTKGALKNTYYKILLNPFGPQGEVIDVKGQCEQANNGDGVDAATFTGLCEQYEIRPYLLAWTRVRLPPYGKGSTVDAVPATYEDDKAFNDADNNVIAQAAESITAPLGNNDVVNPKSNLPELPIMRFPSNMSFTYADASAAKQIKASDWQWGVKSCWALDPRFNWAPENWWFDADISDLTKDRWYKSVFGDKKDDPAEKGKDDNCCLNKLAQYEHGSNLGRGDRATDPFLFVSNLGYLQSVGELAFLPRLSDMNESGIPNCTLGAKLTDDLSSLTRSLYDGNPRMMQTETPDGDVLKEMPCALAAWKSYQNFRTNPDKFEFGANLYRRGLVNGSQGFYVNPYTQSQEVMLAALANTPLNYWVAGTNYTDKTRLDTFDSYKKYMFGGSGSQAPRMSGRDVNKIATFLRHRFEDLANMIVLPNKLEMNDLYVYQKVWEDMFDALDWCGRLNCTVEDVYDDLLAYYEREDSGVSNYREMYSKENGYSDLNHFARGGGKKGLVMNIRLNKDRAVHKDDGDFNCSADPLRGERGSDTGATSCYNSLDDVDRMFLHSYWRDCFANRQQLFLIFVRAESTALGGTGEGTPAQQGGRAVALVWRDPLPPFDTNSNTDRLADDVYELDDDTYRPQRHPHKMRILFYRQLD